MRKAIILTLLLFLLFSVNSYAVGLTLMTLNGQIVHTSSLHNRLLFLTVFQNDCEYCQSEVTDINALFNDPFIRRWYVFAGVDPYDNIATINQFKQQFNVDYPLFQGNLAQIQQQLHVAFTPTSFIILNGQILGTFYGQHSFLSMKYALEEIIYRINQQANSNLYMR